MKQYSFRQLFPVPADDPSTQDTNSLTSLNIFPDTALVRSTPLKSSRSISLAWSDIASAGANQVRNFVRPITDGALLQGGHRAVHRGSAISGLGNRNVGVRGKPRLALRH